jgi:hypothetical protein
MGSDVESRGVLERLKTMLPSVWIAGVGERLDDSVSVFDEMVTSHYDAYLGRYEKVDTSILAMTPELNLLVSHFEGQGLNMLDRLKYHTSADYPQSALGVPPYRDSFNARADLFSRHCRFWNHIFESRSIDAVISQNFGHQGWDFVALNLAKAKGIPTLIFNETGQFPMVQFLQEDVTELGRLEFGRNIKSLIRNEMEMEDPAFIRRSFKWIAETPDRFGIRRVQDFNTSPLASWLLDSNVRKNPSFKFQVVAGALSKKLQRAIGSPRRSFGAALRTRRLLRQTNTSMQEETQYSLTTLPKTPYIYFPLHFQPEATTSVKGRHFYQLREAVAFLASSLPKGWHLVVKEHPHQWRRLLPRERGFFSQIAAIQNVHLVHHSVDNSLTVGGARAIACVSHSSVTAFAVSNGIPVISLGDSHFREAPNYHCIDTSSQLENVMERLAAGAFQSEPEEFEHFITKLENSTLEGVLGYRPVNVEQHEYERILKTTHRNISLAICYWLAHRGLIQPLR